MVLFFEFKLRADGHDGDSEGDDDNDECCILFGALRCVAYGH